MVDPNCFRPVELPPGMEALTAELLADLYDLGTKYGIDVAGAPSRRIAWDGPRGRVCLSVSVAPSPLRNIMVSREPGIAKPGECHLILIDDDPCPFVLWEKTVGIDEVAAMIAALDADMAARGAMDPATRERRRAPHPGGRPKLSVDTMFPNRGDIVEPMGDGDLEVIRRQFDRPDDVEIITLQTGRKAFCRKADVPLLERMSEVTLSVLSRYGVAIDEFPRLPDSRKRMIEAAIARALSGDDN